MKTQTFYLPCKDAERVRSPSPSLPTNCPHKLAAPFAHRSPKIQMGLDRREQKSEPSQESWQWPCSSRGLAALMIWSLAALRMWAETLDILSSCRRLAQSTQVLLGQSACSCFSQCLLSYPPLLTADKLFLQAKAADFITNTCHWCLLIYYRPWILTMKLAPWSETHRHEFYIFLHVLSSGNRRQKVLPFFRLEHWVLEPAKLLWKSKSCYFQSSQVLVL